MPKRRLKKEDRLTIDVRLVIEKYNQANPDKPINQVKLAEMLGVSSQVLTDWQSVKKNTPKWAFYMLKMAELSGCQVTDFVRPE